MQDRITHVVTGAFAGLLLYLYLNFHDVAFTHEKIWIEAAGVMILGGLISWVIYAVNKWTAKMYPWKNPSGLRLLMNLILESALALVGTLGTLSLYHDGGEPMAVSNSIKICLLIFILVLFKGIISFATRSFLLFQEQERQFIAQERRQIDLQLHALKNKLSPHFLFNCLNAISSLLHKDVNKAETFIRQLAKSYEYTLDKYDKPWVTLEEELAVVDAYHFLLSTRFARHLQLDIHIPPELRSTRIPPLTLQMLVENAAKHNLVDENHKLKVEIKANNDWISVTNNLTGVPQLVTSNGIGLSNIADRYKILASKKIMVENNGIFTVKLPIVS